MPPAALREGRHQLAGNALGDDLSQMVFSGHGEIDGIGERDRRAVLAVFSVAGGAVLFVEGREVEHLFGAHDFGSGSGPAGNMTAAGEAMQAATAESDCTASARI